RLDYRRVAGRGVRAPACGFVCPQRGVAVRLQSVARGRLVRRLVFAVMRRVTGRDVPDIIKVRYHRPRFFGKPFFELAQAMMRGPSPWTIGERELFAAF